MYLKRTKTANGRVYMAITQSYRDMNGAPRSRTVKSLGYLDDLDAKYGNGMSYCLREKERLEAEYTKKRMSMSVFLDTSARLQAKPQVNSTIRKNIGFLAYRVMYRKLNLASYLKGKATRAKITVPFAQVIEYLVYAYLNDIRNWKEAFRHKDTFFASFNFTYDEMIEALKFVALIDTDILRRLFHRIEKMGVAIGSTGYLAITNFYFDKDEDNNKAAGNDKDEDKGEAASTDEAKGEAELSRFDSMVQVGMLWDSNRFPVSYSVFFGSDYEKRVRKHLNAAYVMGMLKEHYPELNSIVVVADKGASASDATIAQITKAGDYLFGLHPVECAPETREWIMSSDGYKQHGSDNYRSKERLITRRVETGFGRYTSRRVIPERQIAIWSKHQEGQQRTLRAPLTASAFEAQGSNKNEDFDTLANIWADGYRLLVTSQTHNTIFQSASIYQLIQLTRESFHSTHLTTRENQNNITWEEQIKAHCLISYLASLVVALLHDSLDERYSARQIEQALALANGTELENGWYVFDYYDEVLQAIGSVVGIDFGRKYMSAEEIRQKVTQRCTAKISDIDVIVP